MTAGARRILILAPHPDDEIVACGIAAMRARAADARVFVLYLTSGVPERAGHWRWQRRAYPARLRAGAPRRSGGGAARDGAGRMARFAGAPAAP